MSELTAEIGKWVLARLALSKNERLLIERCRMLPKHDQVRIQQYVAILTLRIRKPFNDPIQAAAYKGPQRTDAAKRLTESK